jgi:hypothetical protein
MARSQLLEHKGKQILFHDYSGIDREEYVATINTLTEEVVQTASSGGGLLLLDISGTYIDREVLEAFTRAGKRVRPHVDRTAVVGLEGVQRLFLNVVNKLSDVGAKPFDNLELAKDWLASD